MNWFSHRAARVTLLMALALGLAGTARAQVTRSLTVAVLNFSNSSGVGGALVGNKAAAAVETQLIESGRYDVVKGDLVQKTMSDLSLTYPLGSAGMTQLAQALEADAIITGDVQSVTRDAKTNQVRVRLRIEMTDRTSGELTNGAIATGESGIRPDFSGSEDVLLDEALSKAAFTGVRSMNDRILPEGTVFATSSRGGQIEALLNIGTNSGVKPGMEFIVLRNREQVARLRATGVSATDTTATVVSSTRGVQPEDKVRAVFRLADIPVDRGGTTGRTSVRAPRMNFGNLALGALMLFGIYRVTQGDTGSGSPGARVTAVSSGPDNGAPGADVYGFVPSIRVSWRPPAGVAQTDIVGYSIYRETRGPGFPAWFVPGGGTRYFYDDGRARKTTGTSGDSGGGGTNSAVLSGQVDGLAPGVTERYVVRTAYRVNPNGSNQGGNDNGGTGGTGGTSGTITYTDSKPGTAATALLPPRALGADVSDPNAAVFTFQQVPGGDHYVVQVSDNPKFTNADTYPRTGDLIYQMTTVPGPPQYFCNKDTKVADPNGSDICDLPDPRFPEFLQAPFTKETYSDLVTPEHQEMLNLNTGRLPAPVLGGKQYYWRVGVYSSRDDLRPENGGYVWGEYLPLNAAPSVAAGPSLIGGPSLVSPIGPRHPGVGGPGEGGGAGLPGGGRHDRDR